MSGIADFRLPENKMVSVSMSVNLSNFAESLKFQKHAQNFIGPEVQDPCKLAANGTLRSEVLQELPGHLDDLIEFIRESYLITNAIYPKHRLANGSLFGIKITKDMHEKKHPENLIKQIQIVKAYVLAMTKSTNEKIDFYIQNLAKNILVLNKNAEKCTEKEKLQESKLKDILKSDSQDPRLHMHAEMEATAAMLDCTWASIYSTTANLFNAVKSCAEGTKQKNSALLNHLENASAV